MDAIITAFASGKGGTGKSTVSVMVGAALAALGQKVALIELSPSLRSDDVIAGVSDAAVFDLEDVLSGRVGPGRAMVESPLYEGLSLILAPYSGGTILADNVELLCERFRYHYNHVLLDVCSGINSAVLAAAEIAHRLVLVETPDPVALRSGRVLVDKFSPDMATPRLLLNRVSVSRVLKDSTLADLDEAIDLVGAQLLGVVPESPAIGRAASFGTALAKDSMENDVFTAIARRINGEDVPLVIK